MPTVIVEGVEVSSRADCPYRARNRARDRPPVQPWLSADLWDAAGA